VSSKSEVFVCVCVCVFVCVTVGAVDASVRLLDLT